MATAVTRQNTITLTTNQQASYEMPALITGNPGVFNWDVFNLGPGDLWMRWDGVAATVNDPGSIHLPALIGFNGATTNMMTVVAGAATTITFTVNDRG